MNVVHNITSPPLAVSAHPLACDFSVLTFAVSSSGFSFSSRTCQHPLQHRQRVEPIKRFRQRSKQSTSPVLVCLYLYIFYFHSIYLVLSFCPLPGSWHRNLFFNTSESGARKFGQLLEAVEVVDLVNDVDLLNAVHIANDGHLANEVHPPTADDHSFGEFVEYDS